MEAQRLQQAVSVPALRVSCRSPAAQGVTDAAPTK